MSIGYPKGGAPIAELGEWRFVTWGEEVSKLASLLCLMEGPSAWKADSSHRSRRLQRLVSTERALYRERAPVPLSTLSEEDLGGTWLHQLSLLTPFSDGKRKESNAQGSLGPSEGRRQPFCWHGSQLWMLQTLLLKASGVSSSSLNQVARSCFWTLPSPHNFPFKLWRALTLFLHLYTSLLSCRSKILPIIRSVIVSRWYPLPFTRESDSVLETGGKILATGFIPHQYNGFQKYVVTQGPRPMEGSPQRVFFCRLGKRFGYGAGFLLGQRSETLPFQVAPNSYCVCQTLDPLMPIAFTLLHFQPFFFSLRSYGAIRSSGSSAEYASNSHSAPVLNESPQALK